MRVPVKGSAPYPVAVVRQKVQFVSVNPASVLGSVRVSTDEVLVRSRGITIGRYAVVPVMETVADALLTVVESLR
jgi:hypothetical protein